MNICRKSLVPVWIAALMVAGLGWGQAARAGTVTSIWRVAVDTSSLAATTGALEFGLVAGNTTAPPATATITDFTTTGTLAGSPTVVGDVTGALPAPVIFRNDKPGDYFQSFTYGNSLAFFVTFAATAPTTIPVDTTFSFYLYDRNGNPISNSKSPSGQALDLTIDGPTGAATLVSYYPPPPIVVFQGVPEPSSVVLLGLAAGALAGWGRWRGRRT